MNASILWSPQVGGQPPRLTKLTSATASVSRHRALTDKEVEWGSERVRHYLRRSFGAVKAIECARADIDALNT